MNSHSATSQFRRNQFHMIKWLGVWIVLFLGCVLLTPYSTVLMQPSLGWLGYCIGLSISLALSMAVALRVFLCVSQLYYVLQVLLAVVSLTALFDSKFAKDEYAYTFFDVQNSEPRPVYLFGLILFGYTALWIAERMKFGRKKSNKLCVKSASTGKKIKISDLCHVDQQFGSLRVHSRQGVEIWQVPFATMLDMFSGIPGMRVHQRHWVADSAVVSFQNSKALGYHLTMEDGTVIPIGATYLKKARDRYRTERRFRLPVDALVEQIRNGGIDDTLGRAVRRKWQGY